MYYQYEVEEIESLQGFRDKAYKAISGKYFERLEKELAEMKKKGWK